MKYKTLVSVILESVGDADNVSRVIHCVTRLRFNFKDHKKADVTILKNNSSVIMVVERGDQFQIVVGSHVSEVYQNLLSVSGISEWPSRQGADGGNNKGNRLSGFIDIISGNFTPLLGVTAACGWISTNSSTYTLLLASSDSLFYYFPIILRYAADKIFGGNAFVTMCIGGALIHPSVLEDFNTMSATDYQPLNFFCIPIIFSFWVSCQLEKTLNKNSHINIRNFFTSTFCLLVTVPLTFLLIRWRVPMRLIAKSCICKLKVDIYRI
ncbi:PTS transporter subunit EIIB [Intestinirhabdus alba]|jgi:PTS system beta-glucosides-specific IIC component|uniref:PTS EIIB type-1 domain-containing protein n=1 Tax=Intestinirhabdus alba TaxID=2899544 RepID=A0A6L6IGN6_9ENTR|nr:PTS transporter subunit EIIB [Intestinirhabdus alba]MTH45951.1 hypothetical protein [Intestinirhabdus alba]